MVSPELTTSVLWGLKVFYNRHSGFERYIQASKIVSSVAMRTTYKLKVDLSYN